MHSVISENPCFLWKLIDNSLGGFVFTSAHIGILNLSLIDNNCLYRVLPIPEDWYLLANKYQSSGIGSTLYKQLLSIKDKFNIPICAEVNTKPPNELSINFHRKHGFSEITECTIKEGYSVVYMEIV